ncbi:MAG: ATP-grasp domain-containing protein [Planctomycetota bacterium]
MPRVQVILGTHAWRSWIDPFLEDPRYRVEYAEPDPGEHAEPDPRRTDAIVFLSRHETLRRDMATAGPLKGRGVGVVCQPPAVVALAMDKRAMAQRARQIDGILAVPEFTPAQAARALHERRARMIVAKPDAGTEGRGMFLFRQTQELSATATRLYEGGYVLQPFIAGEEYSLNMMWHHGRCNHYPTVSKGRVRRAHPSMRARRCPTMVPHWLLRACEEYLRPFGPSGPVEMELIRSGDRFYMLDVNPRVSATLRLAAGAAASNPFSDLIAAALHIGRLGRIVQSVRPAMEWPATPGVRIEPGPDTWVSTRITIAADTEDELERRAKELGGA